MVSWTAATRPNQTHQAALVPRQHRWLLQHTELCTARSGTSKNPPLPCPNSIRYSPSLVAGVRAPSLCCERSRSSQTLSSTARLNQGEGGEPAPARKTAGEGQRPSLFYHRGNICHPFRTLWRWESVKENGLHPFRIHRSILNTFVCHFKAHWKPGPCM